MQLPSLLTRFRGEIARAIRNHRYEVAPSGILMPSMGVFLGGALKVIDYRDDSEQLCAIDANTLLTQGLVHALNVIFPPSGGYAQITQWYIAPYSGDYTPTADLTAATFPATATEFTGYTAATRQALAIASAATVASTGNTGSPAQIVMNATGGPFNIYGAAIVSASAKSAVTGVGFAAVRLDNPRLNIAVNDKLGFEYVITANDAG